jgi:hypothetical protein
VWKTQDTRYKTRNHIWSTHEFLYITPSTYHSSHLSSPAPAHRQPSFKRPTQHQRQRTRRPIHPSYKKRKREKKNQPIRKPSQRTGTLKISSRHYPRCKVPPPLPRTRRARKRTASKGEERRRLGISSEANEKKKRGGFRDGHTNPLSARRARVREKYAPRGKSNRVKASIVFACMKSRTQSQRERECEIVVPHETQPGQQIYMAMPGTGFRNGMGPTAALGFMGLGPGAGPRLALPAWFAELDLGRPIWGGGAI